MYRPGPHGAPRPFVGYLPPPCLLSSPSIECNTPQGWFLVEINSLLPLARGKHGERAGSWRTAFDVDVIRNVAGDGNHVRPYRPAFLFCAQNVLYVISSQLKLFAEFRPFITLLKSLPSFSYFF